MRMGRVCLYLLAANQIWLYKAEMATEQMQMIESESLKLVLSKKLSLFDC